MPPLNQQGLFLQTPWQQCCVAPHFVWQSPQYVSFHATSRHVPPQQRGSVPPQTFPHDPQLFIDPARFAHTPCAAQ